MNIYEKNKKLINVSLLVITCISVALLLAIQKGQGDTLWHVKAGEYMLQHKTILKTDIFSWTMPGKPWVSHEWLWEVIAALLFKRLGFLWVYIITAVGVMIFTAVMYHFYKGHPIGEALFTVGTIISVTSILSPRPHTLAYAVMAIYLFYIEVSKKHSVWKRSIVTLLLFILWANLHSSVMLGIIIVIIYLIFKKISYQEAIAAILGSLINPQGYKLHWYAVKLNTSIDLIGKIDEWQSPNFHNPLNLFIFGIIIVAIIYAVYVMTKNNKIPLFEIVIAGLGVAMYLKSSRHAPLMFMFTEICLKSIKEYEEESFRNMGLMLTTVVSLCIILNNPLLQIIKPYSENNYPKMAIQYMKEHNATDNVLNYYTFGDTLIFEDIKCFIDGRSDMYYLNDSQMWEDFNNLVFLGVDNPRTILEKYKVKYIIYPKDTAFVRYLRQCSYIQNMYEDNKNIVFKVN